MKSSTRWSTLWVCGVVATFSAGTRLVARAAAPAIPDPCKLITVAELEHIVGPLKGNPRPGNIKSGDISCEYASATGPAWISLSLHDGELTYWKNRNGGKTPVSLPELGKDAFVNTDFEGSADLYAKKGALILRVTMPKGPKAVDELNAIAKKALARL